MLEKPRNWFFFKYQKNVMLSHLLKKLLGECKIFSVHHLFVTIHDLKNQKNRISEVCARFFFFKRLITIRAIFLWNFSNFLSITIIVQSQSFYSVTALYPRLIYLKSKYMCKAQINGVN